MSLNYLKVYQDYQNGWDGLCGCLTDSSVTDQNTQIFIISYYYTEESAFLRCYETAKH